MKALIIEADQVECNGMAGMFRQHHFAVDVCHDGYDAWFLGDTEKYDVVVLSLNLPRRDGFSVLSDWRLGGNDTPVVVLGTRDCWREKVRCLRAGADDVLTKPFEFEELLARAEVALRRSHGHASSVLKAGSLELDTSTQRLTLQGRPIVLSALEYRLMAILMNRNNQVVSKANLTECLYQTDFESNSNVVEVLINRVRKKIGFHFIKTHRGLGYQVIPD